MNTFKTCILGLTLLVCASVGTPLRCVSAEEGCEDWAAKIVSVEGSVQARRAGETEWVSVNLDDIYCAGDMIRALKQSRSSVLLPNDTLFRLDEKTTVTFNGIEKENTSLLDLLEGAIYFFSRIPRALKVATPFVNGAVEGTEFFVRVAEDHAFLSVFEGRVAATNAVGSLVLQRGESAIVEAGKAPELHMTVKPRDALHWAIYYPAVIDYKPTDFPGEEAWQGMVHKSIQHYRDGDLAAAFSSLDGVPETIPDPRFYTYRAGLLLTVGRVDEASDDIDRSLETDPENSHAFALQSIIAVAQNRKDEALELASRAATLDPDSSAAKVALSYAYQANFQIQAALETLQEAVALSPENALAWARLSELWMSVGDLDKALEAAQKGADFNPNLARTQTVLGFACLAQIKTKDSKVAFEKAISLDQAAPLPRLGLGLAKIREGDLEPGRGDIEIAVCLDPNNSLMRSYLGKAFFDEKRDKHSDNQFAIAKELDPNDPTPWFYDAIRKQTINRPIEALHDLQKSIELNDNRAVYRSRLLLDEDLAARSASLGRIYQDLGFEQLALVEGWKSVNKDPSSYSAHRFLADSYAALPRHEIARVSELLQSQLLQPINITPVQPSLAEANVFLLEGAGPADPSFNEFNPLFLRNRFAVQASGVVGENNTYGGEVVHSALLGRMSYSVGLFHHETDGFRKNNGQELRIYNVFTQMALSHKTSVQAEYRYKDIEKGDLSLLFDLEGLPFPRYWPERNDEIKKENIRLGLRHSFGRNSVLLVSCSYLKTDDEKDLYGDGTELWRVDANGYMAEAQHLFRWKRFNVTSGVGYYEANRNSVDISTSSPADVRESDTHHTNLYLYALINYPEDITWTLGGSVDFYDDSILDMDEEQFNPKFGLTWSPFPGTTLRGAAFRSLKRSLLADQTIESTQVAGFNQFFDDGNGADVWNYGIGIDQKFSAYLYAGTEFFKRDLKERGMTVTSVIEEFDSEEDFYRIYAYWTPNQWLALGPEYQFERFRNPLEFSKDEQIKRLDTHRVSLGGTFFHRFGLIARLKVTYVEQDGEFVVPPLAPPPPFFATMTDDDQFWVVDASIGFRLPNRRGLITVEAKNLFDEEYNFQDTDPSNPQIYPERLVLAKFTLAF